MHKKYVKSDIKMLRKVLFNNVSPPCDADVNLIYQEFADIFYYSFIITYRYIFTGLVFSNGSYLNYTKVIKKRKSY